MDSIIKLESDIRKALINKETIAVFFDVEKAYDMLWKGFVNQIRSNRKNI